MSDIPQDGERGVNFIHKYNHVWIRDFYLAAIAAARTEAVNDHEADLTRMATVAFAVGEDGEHAAGFAAGVKAARDAVRAVGDLGGFGGLGRVIYRHDALAAIDAIKTSLPASDDSATPVLPTSVAPAGEDYGAPIWRWKVPPGYVDYHGAGLTDVYVEVVTYADHLAAVAAARAEEQQRGEDFANANARIVRDQSFAAGLKAARKIVEDEISHHVDCPYNWPTPNPCTCGKDDALAAIDALGQTPKKTP